VRYFLFISLFLLVQVAYAQEKPIRLIVRGDDMGFSHSANEALIKTYKYGIEKSIEVIVPSPWFPEAVKMLAQNPGVDVGVHLCLSSEWDNVKWRPVSYCPSLTDSNGYFFPMIWPNKNYPKQSLKENAWVLSDVEKELRAQIELALKRIPRISHVSAHMGCTDISEEVRTLAKKLAIEYHIDVNLDEAGVEATGYKGASKTLQEKKTSFTAMLNTLQPGNTYLFVDHPALDTPEMKAIHHIGYERVAEDRQGVTDLWTAPDIIALIKQKKIQLISYKDLVAK
jgi:chitin disaccharide deacetylase